MFLKEFNHLFDWILSFVPIILYLLGAATNTTSQSDANSLL
ncbi:hypothetical protein [Psychrobacillus sp. L3]